ncbi:MAG: hypothetical protein JNL52_11860 [Flavobacteriales bacterium]|nr:hypothetical protein [Flavobacteriales bacterium]
MVVICNHGIADPLVSQLMLDYVRGMQRSELARPVLFITEEPPGAKPPDGLSEQLLSEQVMWVPLRYNVAGAQWIQRAFNCWLMYRLARRFVRERPNTWLVGYLSYGGAYAMLLKMFLRLRTATVCFEPHTEYMVELGIWPARSLKARVMRWLERRQVRHGDLLLVPTAAGMRHASELRPKGTVWFQPITIDVDRAGFDVNARARLRNGVWNEDDVVFIYVGKFGGIYYSIGEYLGFLDRLFTGWPQARATIIAGEGELEKVRQHELFPRLRDRLRLHGPVSVERLHEHLSAADIGVLAIPPTPSQAYRTPVKTAHYWAAGLPILVPFGVSDDHIIAEMDQVGIVVKDLIHFNADELRTAYARLSAEGVSALRERCIQAAHAYRDSRRMVSTLLSLLK